MREQSSKVGDRAFFSLDVLAQLEAEDVIARPEPNEKVKVVAEEDSPKWHVLHLTGVLKLPVHRSLVILGTMNLRGDRVAQ